MRVPSRGIPRCRPRAGTSTNKPSTDRVEQVDGARNTATTTSTTGDEHQLEATTTTTGRERTIVVAADEN